MFKRAFLEEIILRRLLMEYHQEFGRVTCVGLESQLSIKSNHTCYCLNTAWSLELEDPQVSVMLAILRCDEKD